MCDIPCTLFAIHATATYFKCLALVENFPEQGRVYEDNGQWANGMAGTVYAVSVSCMNHQSYSIQHTASVSVSVSVSVLGISVSVSYKASIGLKPKTKKQ